MFLGQYQHTLDNKGRLIIPARYRGLLIEGAYLTQGFDRNLRVLTVPSFKAIYERLSRMNIADPVTRQLRRLIFSNASFVELDRVGRILIPQFLRDIASLDSDAVIVGVGDSIEIWSPQSWSDQAEILHDAEENSKRYSSLDLSLG